MYVAPSAGSYRRSAGAMVFLFPPAAVTAREVKLDPNIAVGCRSQTKWIHKKYQTLMSLMLWWKHRKNLIEQDFKRRHKNTCSEGRKQTFTSHIFHLCFHIVSINEDFQKLPSPPNRPRTFRNLVSKPSRWQGPHEVTMAQMFTKRQGPTKSHVFLTCFNA